MIDELTDNRNIPRVRKTVYIKRMRSKTGARSHEDKAHKEGRVYPQTKPAVNIEIKTLTVES